MSGRGAGTPSISHADLLELGRWNTPTIYNGWEQITAGDRCCDAINIEETVDFMPQMGSMVGHAVTVVIEPSNSTHRERIPSGWDDYRRYIASVSGPKIVVVQDLDKPGVIGSFWGEVNANIHIALGCVGTITDGAIRDVDEMTHAGLKAIARRLCVGHAYSWPARWNCEVEVFGQRIVPGQLIHADKHGFMAIPFGDEPRLLEAARFMDSNECQNLISVAREGIGLSRSELIDRLSEGSSRFRKAAEERFKRGGEF
jgi:4-hydroxy-4-methyl-2-oxoglutarate aldolase